MTTTAPTSSPNVAKESHLSRPTRKDRAEHIVELEYEGYILEKAKALNGAKATWERVTKQQLPFDNTKLSELSQKYRRLDGVGPLIAFSDLTTTQQRVINRLIAQRQFAEKNSRAEWALECIGRDGPRDWRNRLKRSQKITVVIRRQAKTGPQSRSRLKDDEQIDLSEPLPAKKKDKAKKTSKLDRALVDDLQHDPANLSTYLSYEVPFPAPLLSGTTIDNPFAPLCEQYGNVAAQFHAPPHLQSWSSSNMSNSFASPEHHGKTFLGPEHRNTEDVFQPTLDFRSRLPSARHIAVLPDDFFDNRAGNEPEHVIEKSFARLRFEDDCSEQSDYLDRMDRNKLWDNGSRQDLARTSLTASSQSSPTYSSQDPYDVSVDSIDQRVYRGSSRWEKAQEPKYRREHARDFSEGRRHRRDYDHRASRGYRWQDDYDSIDHDSDSRINCATTLRHEHREIRRDLDRSPIAKRNRSNSRHHDCNGSDNVPESRAASLDALSDSSGHHRVEERCRRNEKHLHDKNLEDRGRAEGHQVVNRPLAHIREDSHECLRKASGDCEVPNKRMPDANIEAAEESFDSVSRSPQARPDSCIAGTHGTNENAHTQSMKSGLGPDGPWKDRGESHTGQRHQCFDASKHHQTLNSKVPELSHTPGTPYNAVSADAKHQSHSGSCVTVKSIELEQDTTKTPETGQPFVRDHGTTVLQSAMSNQNPSTSRQDNPASFDTLRDLQIRTQRLLILTKPESPQTSDGSATGETASLSSFGSPIRSPDPYRRAAGEPGSQDRPRRPTGDLHGIANTSSHFSPRDDQFDGGGSGDEGDTSRRRAKPRSSGSGSSGSKRYPCVYRVGEPQRFETHTMCWEYVSQMLRHLESHDLFMCSKCLTTFGSKEQKGLHDKMRACVKTCANRACKRYTMDFNAPASTCRCLLSSDDIWAAIFRQIFPHQVLPAPWASKVQHWLINPADCQQQQDSWLYTNEQSQQPSQFGLLQEDMPPHDALNVPAMGDFGNGPNHPLAPQLQFCNPTASAMGLENTCPQSNARIQHSGQPVLGTFAVPDMEVYPVQTVSHADLQRLRQQLAVLEQRVERPRRSEQKESAMLRLAWKRLVEIGDQSVQEGGLLRQVAEHLAPELIGESTPEDNAATNAQVIDASNPMDWDAAGLGTQHLPVAGKGKQRAVSGVTDSAYFSGMHMGQ